MLKSKLIALAVACAVIPVAGFAQQPAEIAGDWLLNVKLPGGRTMLAVSELLPNGKVLEFDSANVPQLLGGEGKKVYSGKGVWVADKNGSVRVEYRIELAAGKSETVKGEATVSGDRFTGTAQVQFLDESGKTLYATSAAVEGYKDRNSRLTARE
jgi:hypothetical protein